MTPLVSVIIPLFDEESNLCRCLDSVIDQTLRDIEIICVDDCSKDNSPEILRCYEKKDERIRIFRNRKNSGLSFSRNKGMEAAEGEYLFFLDADDYIELNALERLYDSAVKDNLDIIGFCYDETFEHSKEGDVRLQRKGLSFVSTEKVISGRDFFCNCVERNITAMMSWMYLYKGRFLREEGLTFETGIIHEDNLFFIESMIRAKRVKGVPDVYYHYCRHSNSLSLSEDKLLWKIDSLCHILFCIGMYLKHECDPRMVNAITKYMAGISRAIIKNYKKVDYINKDHRFRHAETRAILSICKSGLYNGYYLNKLLPDEMELVRSADRIVIYGAGKTGHGLRELLAERGEYANCFAVSRWEDVNHEENIFHISELAEYKESTVVLIASINDADTMKSEALRQGFEKVIIPSCF